MARLDKTRQGKLEPIRYQRALKYLSQKGYETRQVSTTCIEFDYKGSTVRFWPYSGWHSGKTIEDGRGWNHLEKQIR